VVASAEPVKLEKPSGMSKEEGELWATLTRLLRGVLKEQDGPMLAELCRSWAQLDLVRKSLRESKPGERGYNQLLTALKMCLDSVEKIAAKFPLTPAERGRLKVGVESGPPVAKVPVRPRTRLDASGPPAGSK
jgi:hypothetical protein